MMRCAARIARTNSVCLRYFIPPKMIGYLDGIVISSRDRSVIVNVGGIGYRVRVNTAIATAARAGTRCALFIHTHQTSDAMTLFGFADEATLAFFEELLSVNGVGPKTSLDILEQPIEAIRALIVAGDAKALAATPGIGPKTAARIVLELRAKMVKGAIDVPIATTDVSDDVIDALEQLGYKKAHIKKALMKLPADITQTAAIVTWFLRGA